MNKNPLLRLLISLLASIALMLASACTLLPLLGKSDQASSKSGKGWMVWVRTSPCAGRFDWISVAKENPGLGGTGYYQTADLIQSPLKCTQPAGCTFDEAMAEAALVRASPMFSNYCCREYSVWENIETGELSILKGPGSRGYGWRLVPGKTNLCCEEAEAAVGKTGLCGGIPVSKAPNSCFSSDSGAGVVNRNDHLNYAQQNESRLLSNLRFKIDLLFDCPSLRKETLDCAFAEISLLIGKYVDAGCFNGDQGAVTLNRAEHYDWSVRQSQALIREDMQRKVATAFSCLAPANRANFFADLSVAIAQAPDACAGNGSPVVPPTTPSIGDTRNQPIARHWQLVSVSVTPETPPRGWSYSTQSPAAQNNANDGSRFSWQWTQPPQQFEMSFTVSANTQASAPSQGRAAGMLSLACAGFTTEVPDGKGFAHAVAENGASASGQTTVTFKPMAGATEARVEVSLMGGEVVFVYNYRHVP
ncbi:MAG: hypothetical protein U0Y68_13080 [Blastocatellia bacterium]